MAALYQDTVEQSRSMPVENILKHLGQTNGFALNVGHKLYLLLCREIVRMHS